MTAAVNHCQPTVNRSGRFRKRVLGEHSTRHHATNRAWRDALAAVAIGAVDLGDKGEADKYKQYNAGHVADLIQAGASRWGTDWLGESKVPSSLCSSPPHDQCDRVGHLVAFGCTEEPLHRTILGCRERGVPADGPYDHATGKGHVPFYPGDYHDALRRKNNQVVPLIVEALGGVARRATRCLKFCARRAKDKKRGRDGTKYSRFHPSNYLSHHLANIVTAAVYHDALSAHRGGRLRPQAARPRAGRLGRGELDARRAPARDAPPASPRLIST